MKKDNLILYLFLAIHTIFTIVGFIYLPSTLVMQVTFGGEAGTTLPKFVGLFLLLAVVTYGNLRLYKRDPGKQGLVRLAVVNIIFLVLEITIFIWNI